jgi:hypothetical protein
VRPGDTAKKTGGLFQLSLKGPSHEEGGCAMPVLIRRYKGHNGMMQEERIDDDDRIERYFRLFEKEDVKKLETGVKVFIEKDEWQLLP